MSKRLNLPSALGILLIALFSANVSQAQTNAYWDVNGTNSGQGGSATFSSSGVYWTTNSTNATANTGGPANGALFNLTNGAAAGQSGNYILNFGGTAGDVKQGGNYEAVGINFLTTGYNWYLDGSGTNARTITTTNGVNIGANALTLSNGTTGTNSFTFAAPAPPAPAVYTNSSVFSNNITTTNFVITGTNGGRLILKNYASPAISPFVVYVNSPSTTKFTNIVGSVTNTYTNTVIASISSNAPITVDIGAGSKIMLGTTSSQGGQIDANIINSSASGVALNLTNPSSGVITFNGVISGTNGLVLDNTSNGKILLNAANTYGGGTIVNSTASGDVRYNTSTAFGTGRITISDGATSYLRANVSLLDVTNAVTIGTGSTLQLAVVNSGHKTTWSGVISGAGGINYGYSDAGLYLTGTNSSFGGGVNVSSSGTLYVNKLGMAGANSSIGTNGNITISPSGTTGAGKVRWTGSTNETSDKNFALTASSSLATAGMQILVDNATNSTLTLNGNIISTGINNKVITLAGYNTNTLVMNGTINETAGYTNSVVIGVSSSGTVVLGNNSNSFSGGVTITNATASQNTWLEVAGIGVVGSNSYIGKGSTITFGSGTNGAGTILRYVGAGEISGKILNSVGTNNVMTLDQSGAGNLKFTSALTGSGTGTKTIALQGSTNGTGELAGAISDLGGNVTSLTKYGSGAWTLSGTNTYTGTSTFGGGTTIISGDNRAAVGNVTISGSATYVRLENINAISSSSSLVGMGGTIAQSSTLDFKAAGDVTFNSYGVSSSSSGGSMNFTNSSGSSKTVFFTNADNYITQASSGARGLSIKSADLTLDFVGNIQNSSTTTNTTTFDGAGNFIVRRSLLDTTNATGIRTIAKTGAGTLTLLGASNNYSGSTLVSGGTLEVGAAGALPTASAITVSNGATLRFLKSSGVISVGSLTNAGTLEQNLVTITNSGAVNLTGSAIKVNGSPSLDSYTLVTGTSLTGTPTLSSSIPNYKLSNSPTSLLLVKKATPAVVVTPGTYTYSGAIQGPGTAEVSTGGSTSTPSLSYSGTTSSGSTYGPSTTPPTAPGSYTVTATTAEDPNYLAGTSSATAFTIGKATPSITAAPTASDITFGQTLADSNLTGGTASTPGSFAFTTPSTSPNVGTANQGVTFTPSDTTNYSTATTSASVTVGKATPTISVAPTASDITYGQTLADSNLTGGTASTPGSFAFTSPSTSPNVGTANQGVTFTPSDTTNYNTATTSASVTVTSSAPTGLSYTSSSINGTVGAEIASLTPTVAGSGITYSIDPALPTGLLLNPTTGVISGTPSVTSASAIYTVSATNVGGSTTTTLTIGVGYAVGPVAVDDALTKAASNEPFLIPISDLLANDYRITSTSGATATGGLTVSAVTSGSGNTATVTGAYIQFTPSSASTDTFTYTVTDGTKTATATVTITTETQAPSFDLQIVKVGTATYSGGNTTVTHDFIGVPGQTYLVEYTTNLSGAWTSAGSQSTRTTGSFSVTITKSGDFRSEWNTHMFFRARLAR